MLCPVADAEVLMSFPLQACVPWHTHLYGGVTGRCRGCCSLHRGLRRLDSLFFEGYLVFSVSQQWTSSLVWLESCSDLFVCLVFWRSCLWSCEYRALWSLVGFRCWCCCQSWWLLVWLLCWSVYLCSHLSIKYDTLLCRVVGVSYL